jgi:hypothetical protein
MEVVQFLSLDTATACADEFTLPRTDFVALRGEAKKMVSQRFGKFGNKSFLETAEH